MLIGLTNTRYFNNEVDEGDGLISYQGQRFFFFDGYKLRSGRYPPLLVSAPIGSATITEKILGTDGDVQPWDTNSFLGSQYKGYRHSASTTITPLDTIPMACVGATCTSSLPQESHSAVVNAKQWILDHPSTAATSVLQFTLSGKIASETTGLPLNNVYLSVSKDGIELANTSICGFCGGAFSLNLDFQLSSNYVVKISKPGYTPTVNIISTSASYIPEKFANFTLTTGTVLPTIRALNISKTGSGIVTGVGIYCSPTCKASYKEGELVQLYAQAYPGSNFSSWSGCDTATSSLCDVVMSADKVVTATFTIATLPPAPTGIIATAGRGQATISWNAVTGASSYNLYMASVAGVTKSNYSTLTDGMRHFGVTSPYTPIGLTNGTNYYFVVTAVNVNGESIESSQVTALPAMIPVTVTATPSSIASGSTSIINWTSDFSTSCTLSDAGGIVATGITGTFTTPPLFATTLYGVACTGISGGTSIGVTVAVATSPPPAFAFVDNFSGTELDINLWTVTPLVAACCGGGSPATYTESGGFLNLTVSGGACGVCGVPNGSHFSPKIAPLTGDFEMVVSAEEISRLSLDGTRPLSSLGLSLTGNATTMGIYVVGDALNNSGVPGHNIIPYYINGNTVTYLSPLNLVVGQYYAFQLRIRRVGGIAYWAYKLAQDAVWTEEAAPATFPANDVYTPKITIGSGDGGGTVSNSSFMARLDSVTIHMAPRYFSNTGSMSTPRLGHTATLLPSGKVLIVGGDSSANTAPYLNTAELYDPATGTFSLTSNISTGRSGHTATLLPDGKILVTGGMDAWLTDHTLSSAEIFDPATSQFTPTGNMSQKRIWHTATLLANGTVLIAGGANIASGVTNYSNSAEIYDPATGVFTPTGSMNVPRIWFSATLMNGGVLVVGGSQQDGGTLASAEWFDLGSGTFTAAANFLSTPRLTNFGTTVLSNNNVLFIGGSNFVGGGTSFLSSAEIYDVATGAISPAGNLNIARSGASATLLSDGKVLVAGGNNGTFLDSAEIYDPASATSSSISSTMNSIRYQHTATKLLNGSVLLVGGQIAQGTVNSTTASAELY